MELRDLKAFVAVAEELHFARAAERLYMGPSSLSELIRRLELELGTPLLLRTTRRVELTDAGAVLLERGRTIIGLTEEAEGEVAAIAAGATGTVRVGITPPAATVLMPHLQRRLRERAPGLTVVTSRMWLPDLEPALAGGQIDLALTLGAIEDRSSAMKTVALGGEPLLVGLRADHPLAARDSIELADLAGQTLGLHARRLFPAWHAAQLAALASIGIEPPTVELGGADLSAAGWSEQGEVDWIFLIGSLGRPNPETAILPVAPAYPIPFTLSWLDYRSEIPAIRQFLASAREGELPAGWLMPGEGRPTSAASPINPTT